MSKKKKEKIDPEEVALQELLTKMREGGLNVQQGGFKVDALPSGISSFDHSTGIGGFPRRRISLVQGEEASGKTLLLLHAIAHTQRSGGRAAFVDLEHALTPSFAQTLGVNYDALHISRPTTLEEAYDVARPLAASGLFDVVGFDSAVALPTLEDLAKSARSGSKRAGVPQVHASELPKVYSQLSERTAFLIVNQLREDPNPPKWWKGGKRLYSPGGRTLRHASSMSVEVRTMKVHMRAKNRIGQRIGTYIFKNKVAIPYLRAEFDLMYAYGIDRVTDLVTTAVRLGVVRQSSSWFYFDQIDTGTGEITGELRFAGRAKLEEAVREDSALMDQINDRVRDMKFIEASDPAGGEGWGDVGDSGDYVEEGVYDDD